MDRELMQVAAELYGLPPERYTAARNARAKGLRKEQPELAAQVAKLPKPTAAAAAINRVARDEPSEVRALVQAGRALRSAQEAAVAGKSAGAVADATREHRTALDRVRRELRRLDLSDAVLEREEQSSGFGLDPALVPATPAARRAKAKRDDGSAARREAVKAAQARLAAAKRDARDATAARKEAERALEAARKAEQAATAAVEEADATLGEARSRA
ncbi:MAG TPA: hypothetical protein VM204_05805 [Gaiellaceae bacterium]|nr:hypothetical protein [Gaiellaceae bacterium]